MSSENSTTEGSEGPPPLPEALRTVSPGFRGRFDAEMHTIGLLYVVLLAILFVPILPFFLLFWLVWRLVAAVESSLGVEEKPEGRG